MVPILFYTKTKNNASVKKWQTIGNVIVMSNFSKVNGIVYYTCINKNIYNMGINNFWMVILISLLILLLVILISSYRLKKVILTPLNVLLNSFSRIQQGDLNFKLEPRNFSKEFDYLYIYFNETIDSMKKLLDEVYEDGKLLKVAEYKQLAYQIEPHFLFNSLHIIYFMARKEDYDGIINMTQHLSNYFKSLTSVTRSVVTLSEEIIHINSYINVQKIRFRGRIDVKIEEIPEEIKNVKMPHLTLQPIIENVYSHGLKNKELNGICNITFQYNETDVFVTIEDNGEEITDEIIEDLKRRLENEEVLGNERIALANINRRIQIMSGKNYGVSVERSILGGLKIILKMPNDKVGESVV